MSVGQSGKLGLKSLIPLSLRQSDCILKSLNAYLSLFDPAGIFGDPPLFFLRPSLFFLRPSLFFLRPSLLLLGPLSLLLGPLLLLCGKFGTGQARVSEPLLELLHFGPGGILLAVDRLTQLKEMRANLIAIGIGTPVEVLCGVSHKVKSDLGRSDISQISLSSGEVDTLSVPCASSS